MKNERTQELVRQANEYANTYADTGSSIWFQFYNEKLVELIILECTDTIRNDLTKFPADDLTWRCAMEESAKIVEKHFGVE